MAAAYADEYNTAFPTCDDVRVMCQHLAHDALEFVALLGQTLAPLVTR